MTISDEQIRSGLERLAGRDSQRSAKKEATRRRILDGATALLLAHGFRRTSMEEIAERAGVARATLYTYAKSKEDIVIQALAEEQLLQRGAAAAEGHSPRQQLKAFIIDSLLCYQRMPLLALLVKGDPDLLRSLERHPEVQEAFLGVDDMQWLSATVQRAFPEMSTAKTRVTASTLRALSSVGPQLLENAPGHDLAPAVLAERLAEMIVDGMDGS